MAVLWSLAVAILFQFTTGHPTCSFSQYDAKKLVCFAGNYTDFELRKGIVSDNNTTRAITLSNCRLRDIDYESFDGLPQLRYLDLSKNKITALKLGVLDGFQALTHLNLSYNYLNTFPLGLFDQKPNLIDLDLSFNRIDELVLGVFDPLEKLVSLDLSTNALVGRNISPYLFDQSLKIKHLKISGNDLNGAKDNLLDAVTELQTLELNECSFEEVPKFISERDLKSLQNLQLSGNRLVDIKNSTFAKLSGLISLNVSNNIIKSVDENAFKQLKRLKSIYLRNNLITKIPETLFNNVPALLNIDLSSNLILYVPVNAFRGTKLKNLNLSNNIFSYLQDNFCLELRNSGAFLTKFYFNDNPWQCSCLRDILNEVKKYEINYNTAKYDGKHPVCIETERNNCQRHLELSELINSSENV